MEKGSVFAVNGDYLKDSAWGILDAMLYESQEYSLYSVVNAQNLSITGFPELTEENEQRMAEVYGMTAEQFCRDILWPSFVAAARQADWKITSFISVKQSDSTKTKPKTEIPAAESLKCWIFPKSRASKCRSRTTFSLPSNGTEVRFKRRKSTRKPGSGSRKSDVQQRFRLNF